jgi:hypothetical protein
MSKLTHNPNRSPVPVTLNLEKRLTVYVAAASAAGVALLAATPSAEAKVVYTPTNIVIGNGTTIDLNHDGTPDFKFTFNELSKADVLAVQPTVTGNEIQVKGGAAIAGIFGQPVGPGNHFAATASGYGWVFMADAGSYSVTWFFGPWANAKNRYLGFKFEINGQTHYGWARLSVGDYIHNQPVVLTGYAYETTPNTKIIDGELTGTAENLLPPDLLAPVPPVASLGMLARGTDAMPLWRREEETLNSSVS